MDIIVQVKNCIKAAIYQVKANISVYSRHSGIDFIRKRKLTLPVLIRFLLCLESNSLGKSLLTFFDKGNPPTETAVAQQRRKLLPAGKYALSLHALHAKKMEFIQQEVYAKLLMYNACTVVKDYLENECLPTSASYKYDYALDFTDLSHVIVDYIRHPERRTPSVVKHIILRSKVPKRPNRHASRVIRYKGPAALQYR